MFDKTPSRQIELNSKSDNAQAARIRYFPQKSLFFQSQAYERFWWLKFTRRAQHQQLKSRVDFIFESGKPEDAAISSSAPFSVQSTATIKASIKTTTARWYAIMVENVRFDWVQSCFEPWMERSCQKQRHDVNICGR